MTIIAIVDTILWTLALLGALFFLGIVVAGVGGAANEGDRP